MAIGIGSRIPASSIRLRLTFLFATFLAIALLVFSAVLYRAFIQEQQSDFDKALFNYATDIADSIDVNVFGSIRFGRDIMLDRGKIFPFLVGSSYVQIVDRFGNMKAKSLSLGGGKLPIYSGGVFNVSRFQTTFRTIEGSSISQRLGKRSFYRMITYPIDKGGSVEYILVVAVPQVFIETQTKRLIRFFFWAIPIGLVAFSVLGFIVAGRALAPVGAIIKKAKEIEASELSERLPVPRPDDELRALTLTLNELLDRLERAFESQEKFVADASHQLKTPLAILRGELDVLKSRDRPIEEYREFLDSASQELNYLSRMVDDLLMMARVESSGREVLVFESVHLEEVVMEAASRLELKAREKNIKLKLNLTGDNWKGEIGEFIVNGDPDLLRTMIENLIENALKFSPQGERVEVDVRDHGESISVGVRNFGKIIPEDQLQTVFQRFYRGSEHKQSPGMGLGLAIVKRIVELHNGQVAVTSAEGEGTQFTVEVPRDLRA